MTAKLTISLPDEVADLVRAAVKSGRAATVSAYVAAAILDFEDPQTQARADAQLSAISIGTP